VTLPATAGLLVLARPVVRLLYERGRFGPDATEGTAAALLFYAFGLVAYTSVKVLAPAFYALGTPRVALLASGLAVLTNLVANVTLYERFGFRAVALGTSLGSLANAGLLLLVFERRFGGLVDAGALSRLTRMALATGGMALLLVPLSAALEAAVGTRGLLAQGVTGLVPVALGVAVYLGLARLVRLPEATALMDVLARRAR
jgi:putative peptidoglycan lipid II flippase